MTWRRRRSMGLTLVEVLVAAAVAGIVLSFLGAFFAAQTRYSRDQQVRSDLQTLARTAGEFFTQDFQLVGSRAVSAVNDATASRRAVYAFTSPNLDSETCWDVPSDCLSWDASASTLSLTYMSSVWADGEDVADPAVLDRACRRVQYVVRDGALLRSDVSCPTSAPDLTTTLDPFGYQVVRGVTGVSVDFVCEDDPTLALSENHSDPSRCYDVGRASFVRSALVSIDVVADDASETLTYRTAAPTPNLRPPFSLVTGGTSSEE